MFKAIKEFFLGKPAPVADTVATPHKLEPTTTPLVQPMVEEPVVVVQPIVESMPVALLVKPTPTKRPPKIAKTTASVPARATNTAVEKKSASKKNVKAAPAITKVDVAKPTVKKPRAPRVK